MKLVEIELDLPYQKNQNFIDEVLKNGILEYQEATRQDYESNWKEKRRNFQLMTRCMTSMIERIMEPTVTEECWKIIVECIEKQARKEYSNLLGAYVIQVEFDYNMFLTADDYSKKKMVIDTILKGIKKLSNCILFDFNNIVDACKQVADNGYINEWLWGKTIRLKGKNARVKIKHEISKVDILIAFIDRDNQCIKEELIISAIPDERAYAQYLGKLERVSEDVVALIDKSGKELMRVHG